MPFGKDDSDDASLIVLPYNNPIKKMLETLEVKTEEEKNCLQEMLNFSRTYNPGSGVDAFRNSSIFGLSQWIEATCKKMGVEYEIKSIQALGEAFFKKKFKDMGFIETTIPLQDLQSRPIGENTTIFSRVSAMKQKDV